MYSQSDLEEAVAAGALAPQQADNLRMFVAARNGAPAADEEYARVTLGFNDLFVGYACLFGLIALGFIAALVTSGGGYGMMPSMPLLVGGLLVTAGAWGLSELFLRRRRFAWAGILLALAVGIASLAALTGLIMLLFQRSPPAPEVGAILGAICAGVAAAVAWLHWRRFRVPFAVFVYVGLIAVAALILLGGLTARSGSSSTVIPLVTVIAGIIVFAYAMTWDLRDPLRYTITSDVGLWLHVLAAILLTYGLVGLLGLNAIASAGGAAGMIVLYLLFALISLVVNRRALALIGLGPLLTGITALVRGGGGRSDYDEFDRYGSSSSSFGPGPSPFGGTYGRSGGDMLTTMTITLVVVSIILLLLAIFWSPLRRAVLAILPAGWRARLDGTRHEMVQDLAPPPPPGPPPSF